MYTAPSRPRYKWIQLVSGNMYPYLLTYMYHGVNAASDERRRVRNVRGVERK